MDDIRKLANEHADLTRRYFLKVAAASAAAAGAGPSLWAGESDRRALIDEAAARLEYLTREENFKTYGRGNPRPHKMPPSKQREVGMHRDTWWMEVTADPDSDSKVDNPMTREKGNAMDFAQLMKIAETKAVRFMSVMTCTNGRSPCGMGLWEGVPLRDVIWLAKPSSNVRRLFYWGYHNDDPAQIFRSSLPIGRVLEDPPGTHPITLCYKLNNEWLTVDRGGPVRMMVPEEYGNKCVKWLQSVVLTNNTTNNDTYAEWNNDTVSHIKTCARFIHTPKNVKVGQPAAITGVAQVGFAGLSKVQYSLIGAETKLSADDPYFTKAPWKDAEILPAPKNWGGGLPDGELPDVPGQIDPKTGKPHTWPMPNTIAHFAAAIEADKPGQYHLRCRTIDANGAAQPMPRPFPKSGHTIIQKVDITAE